MAKKWLVAIFLAVLALNTGCASRTAATAPTPAPVTAATAAPALLPAISPVAGARVGPPEIYPDSSRTPGVANPDITQANIKDNICSKTWSTSSIRPPSSYTTKLKKEQMQEWGLSGSPGDYEEDHLVSLQLGGHPKDKRNLWPEKWNLTALGQDLGARAKDKVESYVHDEVCFAIPNNKVTSDNKHPATVSITLARGQEILAQDWYACYVSYLKKEPCL